MYPIYYSARTNNPSRNRAFQTARRANRDYFATDLNLVRVTKDENRRDRANDLQQCKVRRVDHLNHGCKKPRAITTVNNYLRRSSYNMSICHDQAVRAYEEPGAARRRRLNRNDGIQSLLYRSAPWRPRLLVLPR